MAWSFVPIISALPTTACESSATRQGAARGRVPALFTAAGVLLADVVWAMASVVGLTALLVSSQMAFDLVRYLGAAYLIYLGVRLMLARGTLIASDARGSRDDARRPIGRARHGGLRGFREGLFSDLS